MALSRTQMPQTDGPWETTVTPFHLDLRSESSSSCSSRPNSRLFDQWLPDVWELRRWLCLFISWAMVRKSFALPSFALGIKGLWEINLGQLQYSLLLSSVSFFNPLSPFQVLFHRSAGPDNGNGRVFPGSGSGKWQGFLLVKVWMLTSSWHLAKNKQNVCANSVDWNSSSYPVP